MYRMCCAILCIVLVSGSTCNTTTPTGTGDNGNGNPTGTAKNYAASLNGAQEVPPLSNSATGNGQFVLDANGTLFTFNVSASGLSGPVTEAHLRHAELGKAGGLVQDISAFIVNDGMGGTTVNGSCSLTAQDVIDLNAGLFYVNLRTAAHGTGEIRGQLTAQ